MADLRSFVGGGKTTSQQTLTQPKGGSKSSLMNFLQQDNTGGQQEHLTQPKIAFKDSPQGKKYTQLFSQAPPQDKEMITHRLVAKAQAGDQNSYDQLQAIKDHIGDKGTQIKKAGTFGNGLLDAVSNIAAGAAKGVAKGAEYAVKTPIEIAQLQKYAQTHPDEAPQIKEQIRQKLNPVYQLSPMSGLQHTIQRIDSTVTGKPSNLLPGTGANENPVKEFKQSGPVLGSTKLGKALTVAGQVGDAALGIGGIERSIAGSEKVGSHAITKILKLNADSKIDDATRVNLGKVLQDAGRAEEAKAVSQATTVGEVKDALKVNNDLPIRTVNDGRTPTVGNIPVNPVSPSKELTGEITPLKSSPELPQSPEIATPPKVTRQSTIGVPALAQGTKRTAIKNKLIYGFDKTFDLPEYEKVNVKEQGQKATDLVLNNPDHAFKVAMGEVHPPEGILPESVYVALEKYAVDNKNVDILRNLATKSSLTNEATTMGQRIRLLGERDPESAIGNIQNVARARLKAVEARTGTTVNKAISGVTKEIKSNVKPVTNDAWASFVNELRC